MMRTAPLTVYIKLVLIAVDKIKFFILVQCFCNCVQRILRQFVVIIHKSYEFTFCGFNTVVGCNRNMAVLGSVAYLDTRIFFGVFFKR